MHLYYKKNSLRYDKKLLPVFPYLLRETCQGYIAPSVVIFFKLTTAYLA